MTWSLIEGETTQVLDTDALADARLLVDDAERVLFVSEPTTPISARRIG